MFLHESVQMREGAHGSLRLGEEGRVAVNAGMDEGVVDVQECEKVLNDWVVDKIKHTYVRVNDRYKDCKFQYQGWIR